MVNSIIKIIDFVLCIIWFVYICIIINLPKANPSWDIIDLFLIFMLIINTILLYKKKIYKSWREDTYLQIIRALLISAPIVYALIS